MNQHMVRSHWVTCAVDFIRSRYSGPTSERLINGLPEEVREAVLSKTTSIWMPRSYHIELMSTIASVERGEARAFEELVAYGVYTGHHVANGLLKPFMELANLKFLAKKVPVIWERDHQDETQLESDIAVLDDSRLPLKLSGTRGYDHVGIAKLGWLQATLSRFTKTPPQLKQSGWTLGRPGPNEVLLEVSW